MQGEGLGSLMLGAELQKGVWIPFYPSRVEGASKASRSAAVSRAGGWRLVAANPNQQLGEHSGDRREHEANEDDPIALDLDLLPFASQASGGSPTLHGRDGSLTRGPLESFSCSVRRYRSSS